MKFIIWLKSSFQKKCRKYKDGMRYFIELFTIAIKWKTNYTVKNAENDTFEIE